MADTTSDDATNVADIVAVLSQQQESIPIFGLSKKKKKKA